MRLRGPKFASLFNFLVLGQCLKHEMTENSMNLWYIPTICGLLLSLEDHKKAYRGVINEQCLQVEFFIHYLKADGVFDVVFYKAQRQGGIYFYATSETLSILHQPQPMSWWLQVEFYWLKANGVSDTVFYKAQRQGGIFFPRNK
ncbi:hypothetical protein TanjilG_16880 [Lupinus angustifolius]|nr:hypothetical protein TanjilG_16880 [Lupinus angustifolius]